jgi:hypothetical protein
MGGVGVVRVVPPGQSQRGAGGPGVVAGQLEQRAAEPSGRRAHPGKRTGARPASQTEQHRLGLVVAGVREQHAGGAQLVGHAVQSGVASSSSRTLRAASALHPHPLDSYRLGSHRGGLLGSVGRHIGRIRLQPVVHDHGAHAHAGAPGLEAGGGQQGQ